MISAVNLTKRFGSIEAVSGLNFQVNRGEIFGVIGPDGAGKSTLMRMLAGISEPTGGTVTVAGIDTAAEPFRVKEQIAYMPQRFGLYEDLTVEENIYFFGRLFGMNRREIAGRTPELYNFSKLEPFRDRLAGKLSGGMKQKLGLACCLVHRPRLILLDEPTNGVDPVSRREFWRILYSLLPGGVTILVSTAYLDEAERCGRVALMHRGRFIRLGAPDEIRAGVSGVMIEIIPGDLWRAYDLLSAAPRFHHIIREGASLKIFTDSPVNDVRQISSLMKRARIPFTVKKTVPSLENCFMHIVSGAEASR